MSNYLYNGMEFPALPVTDFPFACIFAYHLSISFSSYPVYVLALMGYKGTVNADIGPGKNCYMYFPDVTEETPIEQYDGHPTSETWTRNYENYIYPSDADPSEYVMNLAIASFGTVDYFEMIWSNFDILYRTSDEDAGIAVGDIYLAASDPIPVGSAPEVDPKSFMAGWRMGQFIRGMRG